MSKSSTPTTPSTVSYPQMNEDGHVIYPLLNGAKKSPDDERDHNVASIYPTIHEERIVPTTLDLRPWLRSVRDQGNTSTCAAQVASCIKEYHELKDTSVANDFSVEFVYGHRANAPEQGMYGRDVMDILYKLGCPPLPVQTQDIDDAQVIELASNYRIAEYARVDTIQDLKEALAFDGPCYISFPVYNYSTTLWKPNPGETRKGGHAMAVVGYNETGFLIRNSWGTHWGEQGYCVYSYSDWGSHWEVWSTVDRMGSKPFFTSPPPRNKCLLCC